MITVQQKRSPVRCTYGGPFLAFAVSCSVSGVFVVLILCIGGVCGVCAGVIGISVSVTIAGFIVLVRHCEITSFHQLVSVARQEIYIPQ